MDKINSAIFAIKRKIAQWDKDTDKAAEAGGPVVWLNERIFLVDCLNKLKSARWILEQLDNDQEFYRMAKIWTEPQGEECKVVDSNLSEQASA